MYPRSELFVCLARFCSSSVTAALVERGILILPCAFRESVMIFTGRQRLMNTLDDPYDSYESTATGTLRWTGSVMYDNDLVMKMHGSTTTREYIRRFVRMDKSALRVDTSRQYWTFLNTMPYCIPYYTCHTIPYHAIPYHTTPYHTAYHTLPYDIIADSKFSCTLFSVSDWGKYVSAAMEGKDISP